MAAEKSFVLCGRCEDATEEVDTRSTRSRQKAITTESLIDLKSAGWEYDGISWCCPDCAESRAGG